MKPEKFDQIFIIYLRQFSLHQVVPLSERVEGEDAWKFFFCFEEMLIGKSVL
jgi:hypothetical protein